MPITPKALGLPVTEWRQHQLETIQAAVLSDKKYILVDAPVGSGKSIVALAVARLLGAERTVILTPQKALQLQYQHDFPDVPTVMGRNNFPCLEQPVTAAEAPCTVIGPGPCKHHKKCPYYNQLYKAIGAPISFHNPAMWLPLANHVGLFGEILVGGRFQKLDLLIIDEAHLLEDHIGQVAKVELHASTLRRAGVDLPGLGDEDYSAWRDWAKQTWDALLPTATRYDGMFAEEKTEEWKRLGASEIRTQRATETVYKQCQELTRVDDDWIIRHDLMSHTFERVWVDEVAPREVFRHAKKVMLMSATFLPTETSPGFYDTTHYCSALGIPQDEVTYIRVPSTFPAARRPIYISPVAKVSQSMTDYDLTKIINAVDTILGRHPDVKGLIHTSNYKLQQALIARSTQKQRLLGHNTTDRSTVLDRFKKGKDNTVLVSPSMTVGVDLPGDQCRFIITMKLPYPNLGDPKIKKRMKEIKNKETGLWEKNKRGSEWYRWVTACAFVQSLGRGMRSADDSCSIYVIDGNAKWFVKSVWKMLPDWVKEAIHDVELTPSLSKQLDLSGVDLGQFG